MHWISGRRRAWQQPFRAYLVNSEGGEVELIVVRGLDLVGKRVFAAFGPSGMRVPDGYRLRLDPEPVEPPLVVVALQTGPDVYGVERLSPPLHMWWTNN